MNTIKSAAPYLLACLVIYLFGGLFRPGEWYDSLVLAPWNPPKIAFPIVWTILYVFIGIAGWRIAQSGHRLLLNLWFLQLLLNGAWSWIFFGEHLVLIGLLNLLVLVALLVWLVLACLKAQLRSAAYLLIPYLAWVLLATSLNAYILIYN